MTSPAKLETPATPTRATEPLTHHLTLELTETLKLAVPIALTQLGQIAMMTTDLALIGRLGDEAVAAAALAHTVFFVAFTFGMGLVSAGAPPAAAAVRGPPTPPGAGARIGRLGDEAVAAAALAHTVFFVAFTFGMGLVSAVAPLAAQAFGARNPRMVRRALRVGLWAALLISLPMLLLPYYGEHILLALGQ